MAIFTVVQTEFWGQIDRVMVIPGSNVAVVMGIIPAVLMKRPIFGFLQGASQNRLPASNILLVIGIGTVFAVFVPHNKKLDAILQTAIAEGRITPESRAELDDGAVRLAHRIEEIAILGAAALIALKLLTRHPGEAGSNARSTRSR